MNIFIDTNIFLDFLFERKNFEFAKKILFLNWVSFLTSDKVLLDIFYIWKKEKNREFILEFINEINLSFKIWWWNNETFKNILENELNFSDFEDSFQDEVAKSLNANFIITNNKKNFKNSKISVMTAEEFLNFNDL